MLNDTQKNDVRDIVRITIHELKKSHMLRNESEAIHNDVSNKLYKYYRDGETNETIKSILKDIDDDIYINIIPLYYKNTYTIEKIAEMLNVDVSTVVRNKKRICLSIYTMLEWS